MIFKSEEILPTPRISDISQNHHSRSSFSRSLSESNALLNFNDTLVLESLFILRGLGIGIKNFGESSLYSNVSFFGAMIIFTFTFQWKVDDGRSKF